MVKIPVPIKAGRCFLDGDGSFELTTDRDAWAPLVQADAPFNRDVDSIAEVRFGADASRDFEFGSEDGFKAALRIKTQGLHQLQILWPGTDDKTMAEYGAAPSADELYVRLLVNAEAEADTTASFPAGSLSPTVGVTAGGHVGYERWVRAPQSAGARRLLIGQYGGVRLPQHATLEEDIPAPGEILISRLGGYLKLSTSCRWGYSLTGTRDIGIEKLNLDLNYRLRMLAEASCAFRLAGEYQIEAREGSQPGWIRLVVRKSREAETHLAADFAFDANWKLKGLPSSADELISQLFGVHADRILEIFGKARLYTDLDQLKASAGRLLMSVVHKYSEQVLGIALENATFQSVLGRLKAVTDVYAGLDRRVLDLYHNFSSMVAQQQSELLAGLDRIVGLLGAEEVVAASGTPGLSQVVDLLDHLKPGGLHDLLQDPAIFDEVRSLAGIASRFIRGEADEEVKAWIDLVRKELKLQPLFEALQKFDSPEAIRRTTDEKLKGLVEALTGKAFETLQKSDLKKVLEFAHGQLQRIEDVKKKWYDEVLKAAQKTLKADVHLAYTRARKNENLLDVEVNLRLDGGGALAAKVAHGDLEDVLSRFDPGKVLVRRAVFSDLLTRTREFHVNAIGWGADGLTSLVQESEHAIEVGGGGLINVYTSRSYLERTKTSGRKLKEELHSRFLLQAIGEAFQPPASQTVPYAINLVRSLGSEYTLLQRDQDTRIEELAEYLRLAEWLGMLDREPLAYAASFCDELGGNLGDVRLSYEVRFDLEAMRAAFHFSGDALEQVARSAMRAFILRVYSGMPPTNWLPRVGFAYASADAYRWHREGSLQARLKGVMLPPWHTGQKKPLLVKLDQPMLALVQTLFRVEDELAASLRSLDSVLDRALAGAGADFRDLHRLLGRFLEVGRQLGDYDVSAIAAVADRLIQEGSNGAARRDSMLLLEATPRQGQLQGRKVTRILTAGPKNPEEIAGAS